MRKERAMWKCCLSLYSRERNLMSSLGTCALVWTPRAKIQQWCGEEGEKEGDATWLRSSRWGSGRFWLSPQWAVPSLASCPPRLLPFLFTSRDFPYFSHTLLMGFDLVTGDECCCPDDSDEVWPLLLRSWVGGGVTRELDGTFRTH